MSKLNLPMLLRREDFALYEQLMYSYMAFMNCSQVLTQAYIPPVLVAHATLVQRATYEAELVIHKALEEKSYGILSSSLSQMPTLFQSVVSHVSVKPGTLAIPYPRGSLVWRRIVIEIQAPGNVNIQYITESSIIRCVQNGRPADVFTKELGNLYALQPAASAYSGERKILTLVQNADLKYTS
jgi:hypothetical protein